MVCLYLCFRCGSRSGEHLLEISRFLCLGTRNWTGCIWKVAETLSFLKGLEHFWDWKWSNARESQWPRAWKSETLCGSFTWTHMLGFVIVVHRLTGFLVLCCSLLHTTVFVPLKPPLCPTLLPRRHLYQFLRT